MASEAEVPEQLSSFFDSLLRNRDLSLFLPFMLGFTNISQGEISPTQENPDQELPQATPTSTTPRERFILVNPFTQGMVVIEGEASNFESFLRDLGNKSGQPPASNASIQAMPSVEIGEGEEKEGECVVCLEEWEVGGLVKVMPCKHKFHPNCIEKWLGIHGSCPVCRYKMPVEEVEVGRERRLGREIWVSFSISGGRSRSGDQNQGQIPPASGSGDVNVDPSSGASGNEIEG